MRRETFIAKAGDISQSWLIVDAAEVPLGRLAVQVANVLMGKNKPEYTPHVITGDRVIVTNASKVGLSGRKAEQKFKQRYTEYPGGLKMESYGSLRQRKPETLIQDAVRRMLPKNRLSRVMLKNLHVYSDDQHPHADKKPATLPV
jgi:large subunit ribosomal protein L13